MAGLPPAGPGAVRDCLRQAVGADWRELRLLLETQAGEIADCIRRVAWRRPAGEGEGEPSEGRLTTSRSMEQLLALLIEQHELLAGKLRVAEEPGGETESDLAEAGPPSESQTGRDYDAWIRRALVKQPSLPAGGGTVRT